MPSNASPPPLPPRLPPPKLFAFCCCWLFLFPRPFAFVFFFFFLGFLGLREVEGVPISQNCVKKEIRLSCLFACLLSPYSPNVDFSYIPRNWISRGIFPSGSKSLGSYRDNSMAGEQLPFMPVPDIPASSGPPADAAPGARSGGPERGGRARGVQPRD